MTTLIQNHNQKSFNPWKFLQKWLDGIEIKEEQTARFIVKLIPSQCPFEREVKMLGLVLFRIPPLCKLNPLYEPLTRLRFRALCVLVDSCDNDIKV